MTNTTNYNFNICEGTDVVNPLVQNFPNWTSLDSLLKAVEDATVVRATCITSGTVHAVTYTNTDASVFRFTATGDWNVGDTMTVNGTSVNVYLPNGTAPQTGAFVINTEVLAMIQGTRVTLYTTGMTSIDASDVDYDNTVSGLTATDVQNAIDELASSPAGMYALGVVTTDPGCTVTLTKGAKTVNCTEVSPGVYEGSIDEYGTWAVNNVTLGYSRNFTVDVVKVYNLSFIPDGRTITPTDDVQTLLHCAGIFDKGYTVLSQLLSDTTSLYAVITDNNAIDYLVRSTTFASGITGNANAMTYIGSDNYASDTLLTDATWCTAICNSTNFESVLNAKVPTMTGYTSPSGEVIYTSSSGSNPAWYAFDGDASRSGIYVTGATPGYIGYKFTSNTRVYKTVVQPHIQYNNANYQIQGSTDGVTWTDCSAVTACAGGSTTTIINSSTVDGTYWRAYGTPNASANGGYMYEIQFYGRVDV